MSGDSVTLGKLLDSSLKFFREHAGVLISLGLLFSFLPQLILTLYFSDFYLVSEKFTGEQMVGWVLRLIPFMLIAMIISVFMTIGVLYVVSASARGKKIRSLGEAVQGSSPLFLRAVALSVLMGIFLLIGFILLVIPGIILYTFWILAMPALVMSNTRVMSTFGRSAALIKGRWWRTLGYMLVVIILGSILANIVSLPFSLLDGNTGVIVSDLASTFVSVFTLVFTGQYYLALSGHSHASPKVEEPKSRKKKRK